MGYTVVRTVATGDTWSANDMNIYLRDNMAAGVPGLMTAKGDLVAATGADAAARVAVGTNDYLLTADSSQSAGLSWAGLERLGASASGSQTLKAYGTPYSAAWVKITAYSTEDFDTGSNYSSSRFTANHAGYYLVSCGGYIETDSTFGVNDIIKLGVYKNGVLDSVLFEVQPAAAGQIYISPVWGMDILSLATGDYLEIYVYHSLGIGTNTTLYWRAANFRLSIVML